VLAASDQGESRAPSAAGGCPKNGWPSRADRAAGCRLANKESEFSTPKEEIMKIDLLDVLLL